MKRTVSLGHGTPPVCRLGLATRGNTRLDPADVRHAVDRGVNYLNWCGHPDGLSRAVAELGAMRERVVVAFQLDATTGEGAAEELDWALEEMKTDYVDVVTYYYMESEHQWESILSEDGAHAALRKAREGGKVRMIGMTSHQRAMAARIAAGEGRPLDLLMLRYNAAHRGAERDVFPLTAPIGLPVVAYTCLRWGALPKPTPEDPHGFQPPPPREWYRFALANPAVSVAICAPSGRAELDHELGLLDDWRPPSPDERRVLEDHGNRVYRNAGGFP